MDGAQATLLVRGIAAARRRSQRTRSTPTGKPATHRSRRSNHRGSKPSIAKEQVANTPGPRISNDEGPLPISWPLSTSVAPFRPIDGPQARLKVIGRRDGSIEEHESGL